MSRMYGLYHVKKGGFLFRKDVESLKMEVRDDFSIKTVFDIVFLHDADFKRYQKDNSSFYHMMSIYSSSISIFPSNNKRIKHILDNRNLVDIDNLIFVQINYSIVELSINWKDTCSLIYLLG